MEFAGRWNIRQLDTEEQMGELARGLRGISMTYAELTAENGKDNFARPVKGSIWDLKRMQMEVKQAERKAQMEMMKRVIVSGSLIDKKGRKRQDVGRAGQVRR